MAPIPESTYFPPLEKCLSGEHILLSWKTIFTSLLQLEECDRSNTSLRSFFSEPDVIKLLSRPFNPFSFSQANTKAAFETKTAAINVTPTTKSSYSIQEIKDDSLWLSKETQIDELSALRILVLEYQSRSAAQLQGEFSDEEAVSLQEAAGNINTESSNLLSLALESRATTSNGKSEIAVETRRCRLLQIYLSERRNLFACTNIILHMSLRYLQGKGKQAQHQPTWTDQVSELFIQSQDLSSHGATDFLNYYIKSFKTNIEGLNEGSGWFKADGGREDLELEWLNTRIAEAIHTLELSLLMLSYCTDVRTPGNLLEWFRFISEKGYFDQFIPPYPSLQPLVTSIQSLVAMVSLAMLDCIDSTVTINENIDNARPPQNGNGINMYILEPEAIIELHSLMLNAAAVSSPVASPAVLAWGLILYEMRNATERRSEERARLLLEDEGDISEERGRSSANSNQALPNSMYDDIIQNVMDSDLKEDPIRYLAGSAIDGSDVFSIIATLAISFGASSGASLQSIFEARLRIILLEVIRCSLDLVQYTPEVVSATLAVLNGSKDSWNASNSELLLIEDDPILYFLRDEFLTQAILTAAASRYPYESLPFLKIIRAISRCEHDDDEGMPNAALKLKELPTFMMALPSEFRNYETTQEEENNNSVQLLDSFLLFEPRGNMSVLLARGANSGMEQIVSDFCIPAGSQGRIVLEDNPKVAVWFHPYSGLKYLGKLLETGMTAGDYVDATTGQQTPEEDMVEIISIFTNLLVASKNINQAKGGTTGSNESAHKILEEASEGLDKSRDVVSVIFSIFEQELQRQAENATRESSLDLLITCVQFISALVPIVPGRVWPLIGRCSLLDHEGRSGRFATILAGVELINFDYGFLLSCIQLLDALVEDTAKNAILRKSGSKAVRRFGSTEDLGTGVPENVLSKTILSFSKTMLSVFETSCNWRYAIPEQRLVLSKQISMVLNKILYYNFGISDNGSTKQNLTTALTPVANHVGETFLSSRSGLVRFQPIFRALLDGFATPDITTQLKSFKLWIGQVKEILKFTISLIRIGNLLERPPSRLQEQLFRVSPLIARLYAIHEVYRLPVVALLDSLVVSAASATGEPPSLLGHLGQETSKNFLSILSQLDKPLNDDMHVIPIWNLMSAVVSNRQQWFAIYLLTGRKPRDKLKQGPAANSAYSSHKPMLAIAVEQLTKIDQLPLPRAIAMLEFVSLSQNYWPWAMSGLNMQTNFIKAISSYVNSFQPLAASASIEKFTEGAYHARIAAYVAEILAMYIYHARQTGNLSPIKDLTPNLKFYIASAVSVPSYNSSLHGNMSRNFEKRYPSCNLQDFKRTQLKKRDLGRDYFYDIYLAEKMLEFDSAWKGRNNNGLAEEFLMANVNLSLVDAQVALLHGWKMLAIELSSSFASHPDLQNTAVDVISECLVSNRRSHLPEIVFTRLKQTRVDFALTLLQRLLTAKCATQKIRSLLSTVWETIVDLETTFELALTSGNASYYRSLLKMLFLALRVHSEGDQATDNMAAVERKLAEQTKISTLSSTLDILDRVVAKGFRDLATALHEQPKAISPDDIALITAILQSCLRVPGIENRHPQIQSLMAHYDATRVATTLFSWSDKLAIDGDPIYGELSVLFLLELSTIPSIAEQLAVEGVLGYVSSSSLTNYMRRSNVSPFAESAGAQRCYSTWARGILPLLLNLLAAVGPSIASEVALFLNQFPNLLKQSSEAFEAPDSSKRTKTNNKESMVTLLTATEVHSLSLILLVLNSFRETQPQIPQISWDAPTVLENVDFWLASRPVLRDMILALTERDVELVNKKLQSSKLDCRNKLEEKIVDELMGIREVLNGGEN